MLPYFDYHHTVSDDEIDAQQHVHNLRYLQWTLWAAGAHSRAAGWAHSRAAGWDSQAARSQQLGWVVRSHAVKYRAAARAGDQVVVRTWVSEIERFASLRKYLVCRVADRSLLTRVETRWVYVDLNQHQVVPIPENVRATITTLATVPPMPWE